ncbi:unnamed protein product [Pedinophyceae sp. YPF-701]|nr:unnamed protein product [Pedinophyceae sp. YPF-701]
MATPAHSRRYRAGARPVVARAGGDPNLVLEVLASAAAASVVGGVTIFTAPDRDGEIEAIQTVPGALPLGAAVLADGIAHTIPGLHPLLALASEPVGAAAGVAYMMSILLSAQAIDSATLAPKGTLANVETAKDNSAAVRVPFRDVVPTALSIIDWENEGSSGKGWDPSEGLPKVPINSVAIVIGVGVFILEAAAHAPVLTFFMPRVLTVACWYAVVGYVLSLRGSGGATAEAPKPAPKAEAPPAPKAEAPPAPKAEAKPAPKAEAKPAPKAEAKPAPKAEAKPAPKAEAPAPKKEAAAPKVEAAAAKKEKSAPKAEA